MCETSQTTCAISLALLALIAITQAAPATRDTSIDHDLNEMFTLIKDLSDTAARLQQTISERTNEDMPADVLPGRENDDEIMPTENVEKENGNNSNVEYEALAALNEELITEEKGRHDDGRPQIMSAKNSIKEEQPDLSSRANAACNGRFCKNGGDNSNEDADKRIDELLRALLMLREMETTHEEKRDYDIPFP